ncbi:MAG: hypothetical protein IT337_18525 [Thermomicrobiales bacterium]|nr:hypothetical protein [Thermomicrobiales bacterium]
MAFDVERIGREVQRACPDVEVQVIVNGAMSRVDCWVMEWGRKSYAGGVQADGWLRAADVRSPERRAIVGALLAAVTEGEA